MFRLILTTQTLKILLDVFKNELELTGFKVVEVNKTSQFIYLQAIRLI